MNPQKIIKKIFTAILIFSFAVSGLNFQVNPAKAALVPGGAVGPVNPNHGFPNWYQDQNGLALELCQDQNGFCLLELPNPGSPISFPDNFGGEQFWWAVETSFNNGTQTGLLVLAMEAAFDPEVIADGNQRSFGRIRIRINGLTIGETYTVFHPFGTDTFVAEDDGKGEGKINETSDIGIGVPGDFTGALSSGIGPFLTWDTFSIDPASSDPQLAVGESRYVGNPAADHAIAGSPVNQNFFRITGPDIDETVTLFSVMGKVAVIDTVAPMVASVSPTEVIVDSLGQVAPNTVVSANITDDLGVRAATIDLSAFGDDFSAALNGAQEVPGTASGATGAGTFVIDTAANSLSFNINYSGLVGAGNAETAAHIHGPATAGVNALPIFDLPLGASKIGVWNYPENLEADILAGRMYVNVHSILFPNGEIRGQILPTANVQSMIRTAGSITDGTWGVIIPSITRMGTFSLPLTTHDGSNITNFDFQLSVVNPAPVANPDTVNVGAGEGEQADIEVMLNDTDPNGNLPLSLVSVQNVSAGTAVIAPDGQHVIVTAPTPDFVGTITAEYTVADSLGATANGNITVNFEAPVTPPVEIFLVHRNPTFVKVGNEFVDFGAIAFDRDGMFLDDPVVLENTVDTTTPGTYKVVYLADDGLGNTAKALRTVHVIEENVNPALPSIFPNQDNPVTVEANSDYQDKGVSTAFDILGQDLTALVQTAGLPVDTTTVGTKLVFYTVSDAAGRTSTVLREVNVVDTTPPAINLLGNNPETVLLGSVYVDAGATAADSVDGDLTAGIIVSGLPLDTSATGTFAVIYSLADAAGNTATATRTVNIIVSDDITPPVITILGANPANLTVGDAYTDAGATAADDIDGDITARIQSVSTVNTAVAGAYTVTYTVSDTAGNSATSIRTVNVSEAASEPAPEPEPAPTPAIIGGGGGGGGGGGFLPAPSFQTTATTTTPSPEVQSQIDRQLEIEREARSQGQVLGEKIEFRQIQIQELESEAEIINSKDLNRLLLNTYTARQKTKEAETRIKFTVKLKINLAGLSQDDESAITNFIAYGTANTKKLGEGERAGVLDSYKTAYGKLPTAKSDWTDVLKIANGRFPGQTNAQAEAKAKIEFKKIYLRDPNMNNQNDKAAVNVMSYGLRPDNRNTNSEKAAILIFKAIFKKNPASAADWDKVRAIAYSGAKR